MMRMGPKAGKGRILQDVTGVIPHIIFTTKPLSKFDVKIIREISKVRITAITIQAPIMPCGV